MNSDYISRFYTGLSSFLLESSQDQTHHQQKKGNLGAYCHVASEEHWAVEVDRIDFWVLALALTRHGIWPWVLGVFIWAMATWWRRTESLEKTLMLGKIEGRRRRGRQRMRWLDEMPQDARMGSWVCIIISVLLENREVPRFAHSYTVSLEALWSVSRVVPASFMPLLWNNGLSPSFAKSSHLPWKTLNWVVHVTCP